MARPPPIRAKALPVALQTPHKAIEAAFCPFRVVRYAVTGLLTGFARHHSERHHHQYEGHRGLSFWLMKLEPKKRGRAAKKRSCRGGW